MKKSIISLISALFVVINMLCPVAMAETEEIIPDDAVFSLADAIGSDKINNVCNGYDILENEKYVFIAEATDAGAFSNEDIRLNTKIHIFEKPNDEHLDYEFVTTIYQDSNSAAYDLPARSISVYGDKLVVFWGNAIHTKNTAGAYSSCGKINPLKYYDLSVLEDGETPEGVTVATGDQRTVTHAPFTRGGISYVDEEEGKLYHGSVMNASYGRREYYVRDMADPTVKEKTFTTDAQSKNAVSFVVKEGYLYEVLQQKAGNGEFKSVDDTLVDGDGNPLNNTITIYDVASGLEICNQTSYTSITKYKRGIYTTETEGDCVIKDIEAKGDYVYLATTNGIEVVETSAAKSAESVETLSLCERLLEGTNINGIYLKGNNLYAGTDAGMEIFDISGGIPSHVASYAKAGGFIDFEVNEEENVIYALLNGNGGAVIIDMDALVGGIKTEGFEFTSDDEGNFGFSADVTSLKDEESFKSFLLLYKENKLVDVSINEWNAVSFEAATISDSLSIENPEGICAKVMFAKNSDEIELIPMITEEGYKYKMESEKSEAAENESELSIEVSEQSLNGEIKISGKLKDRAKKPIVMVAKDETADFDDRLFQLRYLDVVEVDEEGNYAAVFMPSDGGEYSLSVSRPFGAGKTQITDITVPDMLVTVQNSVEIPNVEALLFASIENGQNVKSFDVEISFNEDILSADENITVSDEFEASNIIVSEGSFKATFTKKEDITKESIEFLNLPVMIAKNAELGDYTVEISVTAKDEFSNTLYSDVQSGTLQIVTSTPKYDAINEAKAALGALKDAEDINTENYLDEKVKIELARKELDEAYEYFVRDSQIGITLVENLIASEERLTELKPYYDAVDVINETAKENIGTVLKENKDYFETKDEALEIYDELESTEAIDEILANETFVKPSDINKVFYEALVFEAFGETTWQNVGTLLNFMEETDLDVSAYKKLTDEQKITVHKNLQCTVFEDMDELQDSLDRAVTLAKEEVKPSGGGSSSGGSSSKKSSGGSIYIRTDEEEKKEPENKPQEKAVFTDIESYTWAKDAILNLYEKGVVGGRGDGIFDPGANVTREEFAKMVSLAFGITENKANATFKDVDNNAWYAEYVYSLASNGIIGGRGDGIFGTGDYITREEIAVILERVAAFEGITLNENSKVSFADEEDVSDYAKSAIKKLCSSGILNGFADGTVRPKETATRAQVAKLVYAVMLLK